MHNMLVIWLLLLLIPMLLLLLLLLICFYRDQDPGVACKAGGLCHHRPAHT